MKRIILLTFLMMFIITMTVSAHSIIVGQLYEYEWSIINIATGEVLDYGSGTVVPETNQGYHNIEHYIRSAVLGWNSRTRTIDGIRQRLIIIVDCGENCVH